MEIIGIIFFIMGTFFEMENPRIACEKAIVSIDPKNKMITIDQKSLFSISRNEQDSIEISTQLNILQKNKVAWNPAFQNYSSKSLEFYSVNKKHIHAKITINYNTADDLKNFGIDKTENGDFALINIPDWNLITKDGELKGNYWIFEGNNKFKFTLEPFKDRPLESGTKMVNLTKNWISDPQKN